MSIPVRSLRVVAAAVIVMTSMGLAGCSAVPSSLQGSWRLMSLTDAKGSASVGKGITLDLSGQAISGDDSCNHYSGSVSSTDPWKVSDLTATATGCLDGADSLRGRFNAALGAASRASLDHEQLVVVGPHSAEMRFARVSTK